MFHEFVCYCHTDMLCELVCQHLFFLFQQKSCCSLSFLGIQNLFAPTRITSASVSDTQRINSITDLPWIFPKRLLAFISQYYTSRISKKSRNFLHEKKTVAKSFLNLDEWMTANHLRTTSLNHGNLNLPQKRDNFQGS